MTTSRTLTDFESFYVSLIVRREKKSAKFESVQDVQTMLEHFCTTLFGLISGAFEIDILEFKPSEIDVKLTVKVPFEQRNLFLQSMATADLWQNERISIAVLETSPFLVYL